MFSTEHSIFSELIPRNVRESKFFRPLKVYSRQVMIVGQAWEHSSIINRGYDVYRPCLCHTEGRKQEGFVQEGILEGSAFSEELTRESSGEPHLPLGAGKHILQSLGHCSPTNPLSFSRAGPAFTHL